MISSALLRTPVSPSATSTGFISVITDVFAEVVSRPKKLRVQHCRHLRPHPLRVLRPDGIQLISTIEQKIEQIGKAGIDHLVVIPFDRSFASTTAEQFVQEILLDTIGMTELVVGYDYAFGKGRSGDTAFLKRTGQERGIFRLRWSKPSTRMKCWSVRPR